ncbi:MAG: GNAT family N-acetyltransferase [Defluviitaleaceae bacterium]|nr:GNAT family N-acetyltransferase [Defluviitaleaceae bacterium]
MEFTIRQMQENEAKEAASVARKAFGIIGYLIIRKPTLGLVAVSDDKIVGGVFYYTKQSGDKKIGIVSFLFTTPECQGHGIAGRLMDECIKTLWELGCDAQVSYVQDDNVGSWAAFEKRGFVKTSLIKSIQALGFSTAIKAQTIFVETFMFCAGADFYMALPDKEETKKYERCYASVPQIVLFALINMLFLWNVILGDNDPLIVAGSFGLVFLGIAAVGWLGTLFTRRKWHFRFTQGGFVFSPIMAMFSFYPMIGGWYPDKYENTPTFKRDMAINSILIWLFLIAVVVGSRFVNNVVLMVMSHVAVVYLIFRCIPVLPFSSYGAGRVLQWNKIVFLAFAVVSVLLVFVF